MIYFAKSLIALPIVIALYAYVVYPIILWLISRISPREFAVSHDHQLPVSVVIPAFNEEKQIAGAIEAVLAQDYPADKMQILILSDASTDRTDDVVRGFAARGVELFRMTERSGKTKMENAALPLLRGDIIVNTDASIRLHPSAVRELVAHMADPAVGVASGRDVSVSEWNAAGNPTEAGYVNYEMWVRTLESKTGGIVGASGSCYAILSKLHRIPIPDDLSRDFCAPLTARLHAYRAVSVNSALCVVPRTISLRREYARKVRTISRGMDTLHYRRDLMSPLRDDNFAFKIFSHKVCRWAVPVFVPFAIAGLVMLAQTYQWAAALLGIGALVFVIALAGALWPPDRPMPRPMSLIAFAVAANIAVIHAVWRVQVGHDDHIWEPTRR